MPESCEPKTQHKFGKGDLVSFRHPGHGFYVFGYVSRLMDEYQNTIGVVWHGSVLTLDPNDLVLVETADELARRHRAGHPRGHRQLIPSVEAEITKTMSEQARKDIQKAEDKDTVASMLPGPPVAKKRGARRPAKKKRRSKERGTRVSYMKTKATCRGCGKTVRTNFPAIKTKYGVFHLKCFDGELE
jgi:hypothetical protein